MESKEMIELRKIRDANSERHSKMTFEERKREETETLKWVEEKLGRPNNILNTSSKIITRRA